MIEFYLSTAKIWGRCFLFNQRPLSLNCLLEEHRDWISLRYFICSYREWSEIVGKQIFQEHKWKIKVGWHGN